MVVQEAIVAAILKERALTEKRKAIVAVSGGCDSVALLHAMKELRGRLGVELHVASLDHGIRGAAGRQDAEFVGGLCECWDLPYTLGAADVPKLSREWNCGIEAAARRARYNFLARVAAEEASDCAVVGHHAGDQVETILMRMARGTSVHGLAGMQVVSAMPYHPHLRVLRPLLQVERAELESYCRQFDLPFRHDESNDYRSYTRNYLRHEVIGQLQRLNPQVTRALRRLGEAAAVDDNFIGSQFEALVMPLARVSADGWRISKADFLALHPALQRRFLQRSFHTLAGPSASLPHALTLELVAWSRQAASGKRLDIGASLQLRIDYEDLCIERDDIQPSLGNYRLIPDGTEIDIDRAMSLSLNGLTIRVSSETATVPAGVGLRLPKTVMLTLRTRRSGDRFKPKGMGGHSRKLKDWMIDRKIPRDIRDQIPLVCGDGAIIAICLDEAWHLADLSQFDCRDSACATLLLE